MYQNKAIIILRTFTPQEMRQMDDFVLSPFFNKNQKVADLYLVIRDSHPDFDAPVIERQRLFEAVFPGSAYDEQKLRYLLTDLTKLLEEYICWKAVEEEVLFKYHLLLYSYRHWTSRS